MAKIYIRDDVQPQVVYNPHTGTYEHVLAGRAFDADDPFVSDHRDLFGGGVEQATARPGEKRNTRRSA
jgi:hypothetical protein